MIWLMNVNVLFKFSENIKDSMGKFIMPLESELKEVKEKLGYAMVSVEKSTEQGLLSETVLQEKNYRQIGRHEVCFQLINIMTKFDRETRHLLYFFEKKKTTVNSEKCETTARAITSMTRALPY